MSFERWLYAWRVRLRALFYRDRVDRELDDELRHHVALETEARRAQGVSPAEARRQALATLGGLESARNHVRDARFGAALEHVLQDVRYVLRVLRRNPGFTATTVLTLTLAISATTATFSVVDAVLLQPPPFPSRSVSSRYGRRTPRTATSPPRSPPRTSSTGASRRRASSTSPRSIRGRSISRAPTHRSRSTGGRSRKGSSRRSAPAPPTGARSCPTSTGRAAAWSS